MSPFPQFWPFKGPLFRPAQLGEMFQINYFYTALEFLNITSTISLHLIKKKNNRIYTCGCVTQTDTHASKLFYESILIFQFFRQKKVHHRTAINAYIVIK